MDETIIKIENAALKLKKFVIKPANLEIPKGYIVGIQGENGAGKTTLLHMMLGMYDKMKGILWMACKKLARFGTVYTGYGGNCFFDF